jgi:hypothetical protein
MHHGRQNADTKFPFDMARVAGQAPFDGQKPFTAEDNRLAQE